jgi:hypothetical protein
MMCERILSGGQLGYEAVVPDRDQLEASQSALKAIRQDKYALKEANEEMVKEIGLLVEQILGAQQDLQETLKELARFGDDSPYMPSHAVSHFSAQQVTTTTATTDEKAVQQAFAHLEMRISEIEARQRQTNEISGFCLDELTDSNATVSLNLDKIVEATKGLNGNDFLQALCAGSDKAIRIVFEWDSSWNLTNVNLSISPEYLTEIIQVGLEDNSPSFILRETSRRILCFAQRFADISSLLESKEVHLRSQSAFSRNVDFGLSAVPSVTIRLNIPSEYPYQAVKFSHAIDQDGVFIEATKSLNSTKRFASIFDALDAVSALL